mmetsp:Transcript_126406/g.363567  ORF Transcript_126406/g.363567 Transcript_126406/m.363567 type:complete len:239 (+) Transcript_126406:82-798(+)|eukprot:CAMPEP_0170242056 /NCGR_PEP_ID=MMETSP0116_2-20130129/20799_1 /TAXON_ID=400756 /ORGANISM="Durinskia baltica, Strain CSIRO CS-38" /LENGTH=238 /DNA_ID=CAMNT_0010492901 /DNA_START=54 /DNA_END=770 /DNA_ORIENTATION=+
MESAGADQPPVTAAAAPAAAAADVAMAPPTTGAMSNTISSIGSPASPSDRLLTAQAVLERDAVRKRELEGAHLRSFGRQLLSTRRTSPRTQFGYRCTQERKNGRTTWEDVDTWHIFDPAAQVPGPDRYHPNADFERPSPRAHGMAREPRFEDDRSPRMRTAPREDLAAITDSVRPDAIKESVLYARKPSYRFSTSGNDTRITPGPHSCHAFKASARLQTFRDLREQIPPSAVLPSGES